MIVALALGIGAIFGGMNTMYTAVARREREIGVLRVLGFSRGNILSSFVIESALLGLGGGVAGVHLRSSSRGQPASIAACSASARLFFSYRPTPTAIAAGIISAGDHRRARRIAPAWRAARIGVIESLREA